MIQRIQSVYLFLASLASSALFGLPFASAEKTNEGIFMDGALNIYDHIGLLVLTILMAIIALASIFLFKNRVLQMNAGKLNLVLGFALMAWASYAFFDVSATATFGLGLLMPVLAMFMTFMANKNIQKDEKLVRSADRIR